MRFTTQSLANLKARPAEYLLFDERGVRSASRLAIRVRPAQSGPRRDFLFVYRVNGRRRKLSLGEFGDPRHGKVSLAEARERFEELSALVRTGKDPLVEREAQQQRVEQQRREAARQGSFAQLVDAYIAHLMSRGARSAKEIKRSIEADAFQVISRTTRARDIRPEDIRQIMRRVVARKSRAQTNKVRGYLQTIFSFGLKHDQNIESSEVPDVLFGLEHNPARDIPKVSRPGETGVRDIELDASQIRRLWTAIEAREVGKAPASIFAAKRKQGDIVAPKEIRLDPALGSALQLLLATGGQRVEVVVAAAIQEFDLEQKLWTIPHARRKNRLHTKGPHVVPLNETALAIIEAQKARAGDGQFLFPAPRSGKRAPHLHIDVLYKGLRRWCDAIEFSVNFAPRDLRQTWMARAGELGISKELRDRIQDRPPSDVGAKHYDSYSYLDEKIDAMDKWDKRLREIIAGKELKASRSRRSRAVSRSEFRDRIASDSSSQ